MQEVLLIWHEVIGEQVSQSRFSIFGLEEGCWNMGWIAIAWELLQCVCEALAMRDRIFIILRFSRFLKTLMKDFNSINVPSEWEQKLWRYFGTNRSCFHSINVPSEWERIIRDIEKIAASYYYINYKIFQNFIPNVLLSLSSVHFSNNNL